MLIREKPEGMGRPMFLKFSQNTIMGGGRRFISSIAAKRKAKSSRSGSGHWIK